jgi:hypothetical protein
MKNTIKFCRNFEKLSEIDGNVTLGYVGVIDVERLPRDFVNYDTRYFRDGHEHFYHIRKRGKVLLLIFTDGVKAFTTLRTWTERDEERYRDRIGERFFIDVTRR